MSGWVAQRGSWVGWGVEMRRCVVPKKTTHHHPSASAYIPVSECKYGVHALTLADRAVCMPLHVTCVQPCICEPQQSVPGACGRLCT